MKRITTSIFCALLAGFSAFGSTNTLETTNTAAVVDAYTFRATLTVPMLLSGVRSYKKQTFKGTMYMEYETATSAVKRCYIVAKNSRTGVEHNIDMTDGIYNMLGKSNKQIYRTVPAVYFYGTNDVVYGANAHETIRLITLAGNGKLVKSKTKTTTCNVCAPDEVSTSVCSKIKSLSGNINGIMDCICPESEAWDHTLIASPCGLYIDAYGQVVRTHTAPFWGNWSAKQKK